MKLEAGTFIDSQYRAFESDLLFSTTVHGNRAQILQSPRFIVERILDYILNGCSLANSECFLNGYPANSSKLTLPSWN